MKQRVLAFLVVAGMAAIGFVSLGLWQIGRLRERRAANAALAQRREQPVATVAELARDTANARFRAVAVAGRYDYDNEFLWTARTRRGAPGVVFLTPIVPDDGGPAVLVSRGWAYAADGMQVDPGLWREALVDTVRGWAEVYAQGSGPVFITSVPRGIRRLAFDSLQAQLPYPLSPIMVVQQRGAGEQVVVAHPFRAELPPLDEGPHRSYALQWFAFALITIVGAMAGAGTLGARGGAAPPRG